MRGIATIYGLNGDTYQAEIEVSPEYLKGLKTVEDLKKEHGADWKAIMHQALRAVGWSDTICINPDEQGLAE